VSLLAEVVDSFYNHGNQQAYLSNSLDAEDEPDRLADQDLLVSSLVTWDHLQLRALARMAIGAGFAACI
jgi:hypothetical protein